MRNRGLSGDGEDGDGEDGDGEGGGGEDIDSGTFTVCCVDGNEAYCLL